jgi:hypothetical protein
LTNLPLYPLAGGFRCVFQWLRRVSRKTVFCGRGVLASGDAGRLELDVTNVIVCLQAPRILSEAGGEAERTKLAIEVGAGKKSLKYTPTDASGEHCTDGERG